MANWQSPRDWAEWVDWLSAGLHGRCRWRLAILLTGTVFAQGRRTVASWLRAAGVGIGFANYYYFVSRLGRKSEAIATSLFVLLLAKLPIGSRVVLALDDSPTKRYGPKVQGAGIHHNPTPGPTQQKFLYGHVWVTLSLLAPHRLWGTIGLPLWAKLYVRRTDIPKLPKRSGWSFATKLILAGQLVQWAAKIVQKADKTLWIVVDGGYTKRPFLRAAIAAPAVVVGRLRKDAALHTVPPKLRAGQRRKRGRPCIYGKQRISLAKRAGQPRGWQTIACNLYGQTQIKTYKTFLATYRPAGGVIRVVLVREPDGYRAFFCTDPDASVKDILEAVAERNAIEQDFHDVKEVWGAGKQQVRNLWANIGAFNLNLWAHSLVELWAWHKPKSQLCDRSASPWDDAQRRPSHADRRRALQQAYIDEELSSLQAKGRIDRKTLSLFKRLTRFAA